MNRNEIDRVMEMAAEIFAEHGFGGAGMRELSRRCGVGAPTLYHYFGSKEKLFEAVCAEKYRKALVSVRRHLDPTHTNKQQLDCVCSAVFELLVNDGTLFLMLRRDLIDGSISGMRLHSREQYRGILAMIREVIEKECTDSAERLSFTTASLIFGYCEFVHVSFNSGVVRDAASVERHRSELLLAVRKLVFGHDP